MPLSSQVEPFWDYKVWANKGTPYPQQVHMFHARCRFDGDGRCCTGLTDRRICFGAWDRGDAVEKRLPQQSSSYRTVP